MDEIEELCAVLARAITLVTLMPAALLWDLQTMALESLNCLPQAFCEGIALCLVIMEVCASFYFGWEVVVVSLMYVSDASPTLTLIASNSTATISAKVSSATSTEIMLDLKDTLPTAAITTLKLITAACASGLQVLALLIMITLNHPITSTLICFLCLAIWALID